MAQQGGCKHVLIIEDDKSIRDSLAQLLEFEGYNVTGAANGQEGLDCLQGLEPCMILLDLMMPIMDGWQFSSQVKADPKLSRIPLVLISADGNIHQKAQQVQALGYLKKPINVDRLLGTIKQYCPG